MITKSLVMEVLDGWDKQSDEVVEVGLESEFKGRLENPLLSVFGEGGVWVVGLNPLVKKSAAH